MGKDRRDKEEEKERLWKQVMGKDRSLSASDLEGLQEVSDEKNVLVSDDQAMSQLHAILLKQQEQLEQMSKEISPDQKKLNDDMDALNQSLKEDYHVQEPKEEKPVDDKAVFAQMEEALNKEIIGQKEAVHNLCAALRRPYVMGTEKNHARNVILIMGKEGVGRHACVAAASRVLYQHQIFTSPDVNTIDLSRYTSASQEQVFVQDLYQALHQNGGMIVFENFKQGFAPFLRMVSSLAENGSVLLNKRYVLRQGILVENQSGLVKDAVDSLSAQDKYLIFITHGSLSDVQDAFGADFMKHVLDTITFASLDADAVKQIISGQTEQLKQKCDSQLHVALTIDPSINDWVLSHYDKEHGADAVAAQFNDFYISLSEAVLKDNAKEISLQVEDDVPYARYDGKKISICRSQNSQAEMDAVSKELDSVIGLDNVKSYIRSLQAHVLINQRRRQQGLKTTEISKHMIFTGNPGTGKTTIARLFARYMKAIGALSQGQLVEVTRADLVAKYVGQTAPLTMSVIRSALGGVLFIDEAYSLYRGRDDSFGLEAIDTLVKAMEDNRDDLIVILAGYKKEMAAFLEANSGLKSRFPNIIEFPDYTGEQLMAIADQIAKGKGYRIDDSVKAPLTAWFDQKQAESAATAGNGRLARNTIEEAILRQSERLLKEENADMDLLKKEDFSILKEMEQAE
ncbi:MAG: AAA family ATPase [Erysipelotrichaceae bacterium]|jgi:ATP-dependent Clp protease ATP-binding subunit ClpA|nr:AAA family ATPase [Erysipelotrichaceae bacterium]MCI1327087.1 AAA family ATPase [Solobacterium sp.]MCH4043835.1 AAA family ATPase [Erysipelotrichaceae bacterium]MCH4121051.1 AAA family ATPase [Erysipelotrichaceae bacterium]MCI1363790.1 AAA family ATPase [Solobacterium sp.]